jgi:hypothetical protein
LSAAPVGLATTLGQGDQPGQEGSARHQQAGSLADLTPDLAGRTSSTTALTTPTASRSGWSAWTGWSSPLEGVSQRDGGNHGRKPAFRDGRRGAFLNRSMRDRCRWSEAGAWIEPDDRGGLRPAHHHRGRTPKWRQRGREQRPYAVGDRLAFGSSIL